MGIRHITNVFLQSIDLHFVNHLFPSTIDIILKTKVALHFKLPNISILFFFLT